MDLDYLSRLVRDDVFVGFLFDPIRMSAFAVKANESMIDSLNELS